MPIGTKCFEDPSLKDERKRYQALAIDGVTDVVPVVIGYADWRIPTGGSTPIFVVGFDMRAGALSPWNLVQGNSYELSIPNSIVVDQAYFDRLAVKEIGVSAEIRGQRVQVGAISKGIRSFTTTPYVFAPLDRARVYTGTPPHKATYFLARIPPGIDIESVRSRMRVSLSEVEVLTPAEFRDRSRSFWLFGTGAGAALFAGAVARPDRWHRHRRSNVIFEHEGALE
jgi:putative ABC transport system permease protein